MVTTREGYRFIQSLVSMKTYKELSEASRKLGKSRSEILRKAIDDFLKNRKCAFIKDAENDNQ